MPKRPSLVWVKNGQSTHILYLILFADSKIKISIDPRDGIFTFTNPVTKDILLESVEDGKSEIFVEATDLVSEFIILKKLIFNEYNRKLVKDSYRFIHLRFRKMLNIFY